MTPALLLSLVIDPALSLLPSKMTSTEARALLVAIALQESGLRHRRQLGGGPARGWWQFERDGGVAGVIAHHATRPTIGAVLETLRYPVYAEACHTAIEHNDILAACFARCLLWTLPRRLPTKHDPEGGWLAYLAAWRPGKPHPGTWNSYHAVAWDVVDPNGE